MTIEQRLEKLERQNRMFKIIIVAISLGCAAIAAAGGSAGEDKVIMAREFRLIDSQGKTRGLFSLEAGGSPVIALFDAKGKNRGSFGLLADGSPFFGLYAAQGKTRGLFSLLADGTQVFGLRDAREKTIWSAP